MATTHQVMAPDGKRIVYTEYTVKPAETLKQIARDQLYDESRFNEIKEWKNNTVNDIPNGATLEKLVLLLPPRSDDFATLTISSNNPDGMNIRSSRDITSLTNIIIKYKNGTLLPYSKKSLIEENGLLWALVKLIPPIKDTATPPVARSEGWLCVKKGTDFFTKEKIDKPQPFQG